MKKKSKNGSLWAVAASVLMIYFSYTTVEQQRVINVNTTQLDELHSKIEVEESRNIKLNEEIEIVETDEYIEKVARRELGLVKDDEKIIVDINR